jgi:hypothetical protein
MIPDEAVNEYREPNDEQNDRPDGKSVVHVSNPIDLELATTFPLTTGGLWLLYVILDQRYHFFTPLTPSPCADGRDLWHPVGMS